MNINETRYYRESDGNLLKLEICRDPDPMNPRTEWDNVATMVCFHRRYTLGDVSCRHDKPVPVIPHTDVRYDNSSDGAEAFVEWAKKKLARNELAIASLELYDHSGITMHTRSWGIDAFGTGRTGWDSCVVGWIFVTKERALQEIGGATEENWRDKADKWLASEVKTYDDYLTGEVYSFTLYRLQSYATVENGVEKINFPADAQWDEIDNSSGYYGYDHEKNGILECVPTDAVRIRVDELPEQAKEAA